MLGGGKFGHGFVSAGLSKALSPMADTGHLFTDGLVNAAIGGTVSEITGGDFGNGAVMAATQYAFNALAQAAVAPIPAHESNDPRALTRAIRGFERQIATHEIRLSEYLKDPLSKDNTGRLGRAISNNQIGLIKEIITTRINGLNGQIANFKNQIQLRQTQLVRISIGQSAQAMQQSIAGNSGARVVAAESAIGYLAGRAAFLAGATIGLMLMPSNIFEGPRCEMSCYPPPKK